MAPLAGALLLLVALSLVAALALEIHVRLNTVAAAPYRLITDQRTLGYVSAFTKEEIQRYASTRPRELAADPELNLEETFSFFALAGLNRRALDVAAALPAERRGEYSFALYELVNSFLAEADYETARYHAQRLINNVAASPPSDYVIEVNSRLDSCRKLTRYLRLHFPHDDSNLIHRMMRPDMTGYETTSEEEAAEMGEQSAAESEELSESPDDQDAPVAVVSEIAEYAGPAHLADFGDYYATAAAAEKAGPNEQSRALWQQFIDRHPASPLREDAEFNILTIYMNEARHESPGTPEFYDKTQHCITVADAFVATYQSSLMDDALFYSMRMATVLGDIDGGWSRFVRLMEMRGRSDGPLKARYLIMDSPALPGLSSDEGKLIDQFMLRASRASASTRVADLLDTNDNQTVASIALTLGLDPASVRSTYAVLIAKALLQRCIRW